MKLGDDIASASFRVANHDEIVPHPSIEAERDDNDALAAFALELQSFTAHLGDQLTALTAGFVGVGRVVASGRRAHHCKNFREQMKLRTIINIPFLDSKSSRERDRQDAGCIGLAGGL